MEIKKQSSAEGFMILDWKRDLPRRLSFSSKAGQSKGLSRKKVLNFAVCVVLSAAMWWIFSFIFRTAM